METQAWPILSSATATVCRLAPSSALFRGAPRGARLRRQGIGAEVDAEAGQRADAQRLPARDRAHVTDLEAGGERPGHPPPRPPRPLQHGAVGVKGTIQRCPVPVARAVVAGPPYQDPRPGDRRSVPERRGGGNGCRQSSSRHHPSARRIGATCGATARLRWRQSRALRRPLPARARAGAGAGRLHPRERGCWLNRAGKAGTSSRRPWLPARRGGAFPLYWVSVVGPLPGDHLAGPARLGPVGTGRGRQRGPRRPGATGPAPRADRLVRPSAPGDGDLNALIEEALR